MCGCVCGRSLELHFHFWSSLVGNRRASASVSLKIRRFCVMPFLCIHIRTWYHRMVTTTMRSWFIEDFFSVVVVRVVLFLEAFCLNLFIFWDFCVCVMRQPSCGLVRRLVKLIVIKQAREVKHLTKRRQLGSISRLFGRPFFSLALRTRLGIFPVPATHARW